jgi:hypothetical protein
VDQWVIALLNGRGLQAGSAKTSPFFSTAQGMCAFLAAMATTAFQQLRRSARASAHRLFGGGLVLGRS